MKILNALDQFFGRNHDRRLERPHGIAYWLTDDPSFPVSLTLALQHLAIQSIYFVVPIAAAASVTSDPAEITRFLCLSILAAAIWQGLQLVTRGWVGSGYPIPGTHTAALLSAYALAGHLGSGFGGIAAMVLITGVAAILLTFALGRLRIVLPNEIAGVVVMLIGVSLIGLAAVQLGLQPGGTPRGPQAVVVVIGAIIIMALVALSKTKAARLAVLIGALVSILPALWLGQGTPNAAAILAARPWFALPSPWLPDFRAVSAAPLAAYLLSLVALMATATGSFVVLQRAADGAWSRPDAPPLRRGLLANGIGIAVAGLIGGAPPGPATAAVGLSVATGTLARRVVWLGVPLLVIVALCPKLAALFVLMPAPVKAAMLLYVSGFIMAQGCQLATARLLDTRRTLVVALGLSAGVLVAVAPLAFQAAVPALASPLSFGAVIAFLVNFLTLPLVAQRVELVLPLDNVAGTLADEWFANQAAGWGLRARTSVNVSHALDELIGLLMMRGVLQLQLEARWAEDRVEINLAWQGEPLPRASRRARVEDLTGEADAMEGFAVWMATRDAKSFTQSRSAGTCGAKLVFED
ncbi:MAG TPA: solute carrier family 23 protein [Acidocella sp.]|nr:MAG: hypothetical protein B7Z77_08705 [Acidocella sp. 20-58-15]HQT39306.1 solute carrier family 23 protein [Acidocella sp.]